MLEQQPLAVTVERARAVENHKIKGCIGEASSDEGQQLSANIYARRKKEVSKQESRERTIIRNRRHGGIEVIYDSLISVFRCPCELKER